MIFTLGMCDFCSDCYKMIFTLCDLRSDNCFTPTLSAKLAQDHKKKVIAYEMRQAELRREKELFYQKAFEEDIKKFKTVQKRSKITSYYNTNNFCCCVNSIICVICNAIAFPVLFVS